MLKQANPNATNTPERGISRREFLKTAGKLSLAAAFLKISPLLSGCGAEEHAYSFRVPVGEPVVKEITSREYGALSPEEKIELGSVGVGLDKQARPYIGLHDAVVSAEFKNGVGEGEVIRFLMEDWRVSLMEDGVKLTSLDGGKTLIFRDRNKTSGEGCASNLDAVVVLAGGRLCRISLSSGEFDKYDFQDILPERGFDKHMISIGKVENGKAELVIQPNPTPSESCGVIEIPAVVQKEDLIFVFE